MPRPDSAEGGMPTRPDLVDADGPTRPLLDDGAPLARALLDDGGPPSPPGPPDPVDRDDGDMPMRPAIEVCGPARPTIEARPDIDEGGGTTTTTEGGATGDPKPEARMPLRPANPCTNWSTGWVSVLLVEPVPG